jgi:acetolactate decarboxylase
MKKQLLSAISFIPATSFLMLSGGSGPGGQKDRETMYQVSTFNALARGLYDGSVTFKTLKEHGDMGLGTFNALDGEMIGLDGEFYQIKSDGTVSPVNDSDSTPFAVVSYFDIDITHKITNLSSLKQLMDAIDGTMTNRNAMYLIKAHGHFRNITVRSVHVQHKPFPLLIDAVKDQSVFNFSDIDGTIAGVWFPEYMAGINVAGYHFHFISDDLKHGGHLLDCSADDLTSYLDETDSFYMALPNDSAFRGADIAKSSQSDVDSIEKQG